MKIFRRAAFAAAAVALTTGGVAFAAAKNPEENTHLGPDDNPGLFLGQPSPTYEWHGCKLTSIWENPNGQPAGAPDNGTGNRPKAVTFTYQTGTAPYLSWKVNPKYTICGVEAMVELSNPDVDSFLLGSAGYTSGKTKGSTSKTGKETIKVKIKKGAIGGSFEQYEGKTYSMSTFDGMAVFVKKKK